MRITILISICRAATTTLHRHVSMQPKLKTKALEKCKNNHQGAGQSWVLATYRQCNNHMIWLQASTKVLHPIKAFPDILDAYKQFGLMSVSDKIETA